MSKKYYDSDDLTRDVNRIVIGVLIGVIVLMCVMSVIIAPCSGIVNTKPDITTITDIGFITAINMSASKNRINYHCQTTCNYIAVFSDVSPKIGDHVFMQSTPRKFHTQVCFYIDNKK